MHLAAHRKRRGLSQSEVAASLGLSRTSKGRISELESGKKAGIQLALEIELWSSGEVPAHSLLNRSDAMLLDAHVRFAASRTAPASP